MNDDPVLEERLVHAITSTLRDLFLEHPGSEDANAVDALYAIASALERLADLVYEHERIANG